jgi:2',3'-cyclic-nucleotide 2'-phosphodiesterase (5'-nucleotidase family)
MFRNRYFVFLLSVIAVSCTSSQQSTSLIYHDYRIEKRVNEDSGILKMLEPYSTSLNVTMNKVIGFAPNNLNEKQPESGLGNFMADCMKIMAEKKFNRKVDAGFMNPGGIRSYIPKGNISVGKIFELMPFDNLIVLQEVKGAILKEFLNKTAQDGGWPVSSGVTMRIKEKKAVQIIIGGKELDLNTTYVIANSDYVANGGDDCIMLRKIPKLDRGYLYRDALLDYIADLTKQGKPVEAGIENRVAHVN